MTIKSSGSLSASEINTEFGLGYNLGSYRGVQWWTDAGGSGNFSTGAISYSEFYGKRAAPPYTHTVTVGYPGSGNAYGYRYPNGITGYGSVSPTSLFGYYFDGFYVDGPNKNSNYFLVISVHIPYGNSNPFGGTVLWNTVTFLGYTINTASTAYNAYPNLGSPYTPYAAWTLSGTSGSTAYNIYNSVVAANGTTIGLTFT